MTRPYLRVVRPDGSFDPFGNRMTDDLIREAGVLREQIGRLVAARLSGELSSTAIEPSSARDLKRALRELEHEIQRRRKGG